MPPSTPSAVGEARDAGLAIHVNGEARRVPEPCSVAELVRRLGIRTRVAVAVNREVVPRSRFAQHRLREGDRVEILEAVGGG